MQDALEAPLAGILQAASKNVIGIYLPENQRLTGIRLCCPILRRINLGKGNLYWFTSSLSSKRYRKHLNPRSLSPCSKPPAGNLQFMVPKQAAMVL